MRPRTGLDAFVEEENALLHRPGIETRFIGHPVPQPRHYSDCTIPVPDGLMFLCLLIDILSAE